MSENITILSSILVKLLNLTIKIFMQPKVVIIVLIPDKIISNEILKNLN